ncbi:hypothetical protein BD289DRAFT_470550 [Coniella lustricola]|uniref:Uncharacterized protein n=1 Tax=Coniella lustricola TaxID=2025994 RepID=A0A2T3AMT3_9PEZI|nr:hypothetical protein BD289DRAFT_470550 [Coniella lustricola]
MASGTPSGASHRLLTMGFMQRAAAAAASSSQSASGAPTPGDAHSSKRRKIEDSSDVRERQTPSYMIDQRAAQAALEEEERKRKIAMAKVAEQSGDGHWFLDTAKLPRPKSQVVAPLKVVQVGYTQIDTVEGLDESIAVEGKPPRPERPILHTYGSGEQVKKAKSNNGSDFDSRSDSDTDSDNSDSSDSSSEESGEGGAQSNPGRTVYGSQGREALRAKKNAERELARKLSSQRRGKVVKLNKLSSISGAGAYGSKPPQSKPGRR